MFCISILGATGKMGKCLLREAREDSSLRVVGALSSANSSFLGKDIGELIDAPHQGVLVQKDPEEALKACRVALDFSTAEAVLEHVHAAERAKKALLIGTTGLDTPTLSAIEKAAQSIPLLLSANFSLGIALCLEIAPLLTRALNREHYTLDIFETHHKHKKDSPSGTALSLARALGREEEEIPIHSQRTEDTVGEHVLVFKGKQERLEIKHSTHARSAFAKGALLAAKWLVKQPPGSYTFNDVLRQS